MGVIIKHQRQIFQNYDLIFSCALLMNKIIKIVQFLFVNSIPVLHPLKVSN